MKLALGTQTDRKELKHTRDPDPENKIITWQEAHQLPDLGLRIRLSVGMLSASKCD